MLKEFSKILTVLTSLMGLVWVSASYVLSYYGHDPNVEITKLVIGQVVLANCSYHAYQGCLKNSTNKYNTDKNGVPYGNKGAEVK